MNEAFAPALARIPFKASLPQLGGLALPDGGVLMREGREMLVFRHNGRFETYKGTQVG